MIPAPSEQFKVQEARRQGVHPVVRFSFWPHFYLAGMASGSFTECASVAAEKIEADWAGLAPEWESEALEERYGEFPAQATPSWEHDPTAYDLHVYLRTAASQAALAAAAWAELIQGAEITLERWRQFRAVWGAFRWWAMLTEQADCPLQAYATNSANHSYVSYASPGSGGQSWIEKLRLTGELTLPRAVVLEPGEISLDKPVEFGELVAGDLEVALANPDGWLDPESDNFVFAGNLPWYGKSLLADYGYLLPDGTAEYVRLYDGRIVDWELLEAGEVPKARVSTRDYVAELLQRPFGARDASGEDRPEIYGEVLAEAQEIKDRSYLAAADRTAGFEAGDLNELSGATVSGGGSLAAVADSDAHGGGWVLRAQADGANQQAWGVLNLRAARTRILFTAWVRATEVPQEPQHRLTRFMGLRGEGGDFVSLYVGEDGVVWLKRHDTGAVEETSWNLRQFPGAWRRVSIGCIRENPGDIKVWVDGDEVFSLGNKSLSGKVAGGWVGVRTGSKAETYTLDFDDLEVYPDCRFQAYLVPGGPFEDILAVYTDGVLEPRLRRPGGRLSRRGRGLAKRLR
ncbi:MAG: hypothetical protein JRI59_08005, partial [Deltaproteobacteria bacterium]|nr:hypothetical protein [Deltaproteobacteria bacterium]